MPVIILLAILSLQAHADGNPSDYAITAQAETGIPASITLAVAYHESGGNLSHKPIKCFDGSYDLGAGFNSSWVEWYADKFNDGSPIKTKSPESIIVVARILAWNHRTFGDWPRAFTAYRRGQTWTKKHGVDTHYVDAIIKELCNGPALLMW